LEETLPVFRTLGSETRLWSDSQDHRPISLPDHHFVNRPRLCGQKGGGVC